MPLTTRVLVVDDATPAALARRHLLGTAGHATACVSSLDGALAILAHTGDAADVILLDLALGGLPAVTRLAAAAPLARLVILAPTEALAPAREALRFGAWDVVRAEEAVEALLFAVERAAHVGQLQREVAMLRARAGELAASALVGRSAAIATVRDLVGRAAASRMTVLITGEPGTGKHLVARLVHDLSERAARPFVTVRCAGRDEMQLAEELLGRVDDAGKRTHMGLLEEARGGTLVLDEPDAMPAALRARIAQVMAEGALRASSDAAPVPVDVRLILVAGPTAAAIASPVLAIALPPLRERRADIPLLAQHFRARTARELGMEPPATPPDALLALMGRDWPGNVRELEHEVERASHAAYLPRGVAAIGASPRDASLTLDALERRHILRVVDEERGNQSRAAERLGIDRRTLYRKLRQYREEGGGGLRAAM